MTKLQQLIEKWEDNFKKIDGPGLPLEERSAYWAINEFLRDLNSLKEEEPVSKMETTVANTLLYEAGYNEGLADGKKVKPQADIEAIMKELENDYDWDNYNSVMVKTILQKHLTPKEGVAEKVVDIKEVKISNSDFERIEYEAVYCPICSEEIKREFTYKKPIKNCPGCGATIKWVD